MEEYIKKSDAHRIVLHQSGDAARAAITDLKPEPVISVAYIRQIAQEEFEIEARLRGSARGFYAIRGGAILQLIDRAGFDSQREVRT